MSKKHLLPELSVFFPAYNEEGNIRATVEKAIAVLEEIVPRWEVVVVDDGSTDGTATIIKGLIKKYPQRVRAITHRPNRGYGGALKSGLYGCRYQWIAFTDADGQFDFGEIYHFIDVAKREKADLVIGYRFDRQDSFVRMLIAKMLKLWNFVFYQVRFKDADCGFKLIKKEVIDKIPRLQTESAMTETEFLIRAKRAGFRFEEISVRHYPRLTGEQTGGDPKVIWRAVKDSFKLWKTLR